MYPDLYEATISELGAGLEAGHFSSVDLVKAYLARTEETNLRGPALHAVLETTTQPQPQPHYALRTAADLDSERHDKKKGPRGRGPLHGVPILLEVSRT